MLLGSYHNLALSHKSVYLLAEREDAHTVYVQHNDGQKEVLPTGHAQKGEEKSQETAVVGTLDR